MSVAFDTVTSILGKKCKIALGLSITVGAMGYLLLFVMSGSVSAQGAVGDGGNGGGGGGGHQSVYGYGWVQYSASGSGPTNGFRNGASWSSVRSSCQGQGASAVIAFIVNNVSLQGKIYDYQGWNNPANLFTSGSRDNGRATAMTIGAAQSRFNNLGSYGVNTSGYTFGSNVGWFCYNFAPPVYDDATCSISAPATVLPNQNFNVTVRVNNTGTTTFHTGGSHPYRIGSRNPQDNSIWGTGRANLPASISPGTSRNVTFSVRAPNTPGNTNMSWRVVHENIAWIGSTCSRNIRIVQLTYNNDPSVSASGNYLPGQSFTVRGTVRNSDSGGSPTYRQELLATGRSGDVTRVSGSGTNVTQSGLSGGGSRTLTHGYVVDNNAQAGQVCFAVRVSPDRGNGTPGTTSVTSGSQTSSQQCINIIRRTYNNDPSVSASGSYLPGQSFTVRGTVRNSGAGGSPTYRQELLSSGDVNDITRTGGDGTNTTRTGLSGGSSRTLNNTYRVDNDAQTGRVCFSVRVSPNTGNGTPGATSITSTNQTSGQQCINIIRRTYNYNPDVSASGNYLPGQSFTVTAPIRNAGDGTGARYDQDLLVTGSATGSISRTGGSALDTNNITGISAGGTRTLSYTFTVTNTATPGTVCFANRVSPDRGLAEPGVTTATGSDTSGQRCINIVRRLYNYVPATPGASPSAARYYAGEPFSVTARTSNTSNGGGPGFRQELVITGAARGFVTRTGGDPTAENVGGLAGNSGRNQSYVFTIAADAPDGGEVCLQNRVNPSRGYGSPGNTTVIDGTETSARSCFNIYNQRFDISPFNQDSSVIIPGTLTPGQTFTEVITVCNSQLANPPSGRGPARGSSYRSTTTVSAEDNITIIGTNALDYGSTSNVNISSGLGGCQQIEYTARVDTNALLGEEACISARVNDDIGFSDGFRETGATVSGDVCADIAEQAFIRVDNGSVWAGGGFDPASNGFGTPWCAVPGGAAAGYIETARNNAGSVGAYADYIAGATASIRGFGSAGSVTGTGLTFNNASGEGNYNSGGDGRCITNLRTYLRTSGAGVTPFGGGSINTSGQFYASGDISLGAITLPAGRQITLIVDGEVTINQNIEFNYGSITDTDRIPSFILVARDGINIHSRVTDLHGIYSTQGGIDTCANAGARLSSASCRNQLTVRGAFAANDIEFRRTFGGVNGANSNGGTNPAELFEFNPEMYLADHILITDYEQNLGIDRIKDLPPVIN